VRSSTATPWSRRRAAAKLDLDPPPCPGLGAAAEAAAGYPGLHTHAFPTCFVCGPGRPAGDGLRIFAGKVAGKRWWRVRGSRPPSWRATTAWLRSEFAWAALDCPGAWAWLPVLDNPVVLGRLAVVIDEPILPASRTSSAAGDGKEGRKHYSGTVIWRADGTVCARGRATWIEVDAAKFAASG
jgi:hypothetical protein